MIKKITLLSMLMWLSACVDNSATGHADVRWDRDTCERCRMVVSDRNFSAQIRGGEKNQLYKFDDLGCALWWLKDQGWRADKGVEIWVTDYLTGEWLDARRAYYVSGLTTPMDYGLGALKNPVTNSINFDQAHTKILSTVHKHGGHHHSEKPQVDHSQHQQEMQHNEHSHHEGHQ